MKSVAVLDYGIGNIKSICSGLEKVGCQYVLTNDGKLIKQSSGLVIPGVGAFSHGMSKLKSLDLVSQIQDVASSGTPILGICLGMQMLFSRSSEFGNSAGLDLVTGSVDKLETGAKLPHIAWSNLESAGTKWSRTILDGVPQENSMYFVHSFAALPEDENFVLSQTTYGEVDFCSTVKKDNVYGCQFHPEKSGPQGLRILENFSKLCSDLL